MDEKDEECESSLVGGKAFNLWLLSHRYKLNVPTWFVVTSQYFTQFVQVCINQGYNVKLATTAINKGIAFQYSARILETDRLVFYRKIILDLS